MVLVLHFYQPPTQAKRVLEEAAASCYLPLTKLLLAHPSARFTINITGSLIESMQTFPSPEGRGFLENLRTLFSRGQIELARSLWSHPLTPLLPDKKLIAAQIAAGDEALKSASLSPAPVIFLPELAGDEETIRFLHQNFPDHLVLLDQNGLPQSNLYFSAGRLILAAANRTVTEALRRPDGRLTAESLLRLLEKQGQPVAAATDAEVFGHHYPDRLALLADLLADSRLEFVLLSAATQNAKPTPLRFNQIRPASWQSDLPLKDSRYPWSLWLSPKNLLQNKYHELVRLAYHATKHPSATGLTRRYFFRGVSSCYYYWLSCWPWWHPDLVVSGATELVRAVRSLPSPCYRCKKRAENLFHEFSLSLWHHHWSKKVSRLQEQHAKICYPHEETAHCPDY